MTKDMGLTNARVIKTTGSHAPDSDDVTQSEEAWSKSEECSYRSIVGRLQWLTGTRPDIQYAVKELARDSNDPTPSSWKRVKHVIKYLKHTAQYRLMFSQILPDAPVSEIDTHADADWAGCPESRRSTSGFCLFVSGNLIHSASRTQGSVAMSSAESELYALCTATSEGIFLRLSLIHI